MSKPENKTDQIYRQKLMQAEVDPPLKAWDQIASSLDNENKNRRLLFYRRMVAAAAVIILLLSTGIGILYKTREIPDIPVKTNINNPVENPADTSIPAKQAETKQEQPGEKLQLNQSITREEKIFTSKNSTVENNAEVSVHTPYQLTNTQLIASKTFGINLNKPLLLKRRNNQVQQSPGEIYTPGEFPVDNYKLADATSEKQLKNRWSVIGEISPNQGNISQLSSYSGVEAMREGLTGSSTNNQQEIMKAYSGGLAVSYMLNEKLSIQSGLYYFKQNQSVNNYSVLSNHAAYNDVLSSTTNSGTILFTSEAAIENSHAVSQVEVDLNNKISQFNDLLVQQFEFIEIPFILKYKILNKKLDIFLLGGLNADILVRNNVFIGKDSKQSVGYTNDINSLIYKSTLGLSLEYPISHHFYFNLSPLFKYQLNSINSESDLNVKFRSFEYRTGISYRF